jgi:hypothetical protein
MECDGGRADGAHRWTARKSQQGSLDRRSVRCSVRIILGLAALLMTVGAETADGPMVLNEAQLDRITAGAEPTFPGVFILELPGPSKADVAPVLEFPDGSLLLHVEQSAVPNTPAAPRLGLSNLARQLGGLD